jgi:hypothetical protein
MDREVFYVHNYSINAYDALCEDVYRTEFTELYEWRTQPRESLSRYFYGRIINKMLTIGVYSLAIKNV